MPNRCTRKTEAKRRYRANERREDSSQCPAQHFASSSVWLINPIRRPADASLSVYVCDSLEPNSVLCQVECSDGSFYDLRASVHGKLVEVNDALRSSANLMVSDAAWSGYLALFQLMPKAKAMLSLEDRALEGSEAERDTPETTPIREEARHDTNKTSETTAAAEASPTATDASSSTTAAAASAATAAQESARFEGRSWQSSIEYLTPQQYLAKRSNFFVQTT